LAVELGLTYCGDPDAFYRWDVETQERVLAWHRVRAELTKPKPAARKPANSGKFSPEAAAFWGF